MTDIKGSTLGQAVILAIFDLDNTLLAGDSDHLWGEFLVKKGLVDEQEYKAANDRFYSLYQQQKLDINEYLHFALAPLAKFDLESLKKLHAEFMETEVSALILPKAQALIEQHKQLGHYSLVITATNDFVTQPIAERLEIDSLIASKAEFVNGRYTGKPCGIPSFQEGKVKRLQSWLEEMAPARQFDLSEAFFYSDSANDLPLLKQVGKPIAVDPDPKLRDHAEKAQWQIISLR